MGAISTQVEKNNALSTSGAPKSLKDYISMMSGEITKALPKVGITPERFTRLCLSAVSGNKALQECTPNSFLAAMMSAAQMGLEPNTQLGQAYLIPYKNYKNGTTECQFQLGYKGLIDLAYRSGKISSIMAEAVYANDTFEYELGINANLVHKPCIKGPRGDVICYYAVWHGKDGGYGFSVMSVEDVKAHRAKFSKAKNSPWDTNFDEMAKKTCLKKALKLAPLSIDVLRDITTDETVKNTISDTMADEPNMIEIDGIVTDSIDDDTEVVEPEV